MRRLRAAVRDGEAERERLTARLAALEASLSGERERAATAAAAAAAQACRASCGSTQSVTACPAGPQEGPLFRHSPVLLAACRRKWAGNANKKTCLRHGAARQVLYEFMHVLMWVAGAEACPVA